MPENPRIKEAEDQLGRKLSTDERAAVERGAVVIDGRIVESSEAGRADEARK